jgi:hypothetical protein
MMLVVRISLLLESDHRSQMILSAARSHPEYMRQPWGVQYIDEDNQDWEPRHLAFGRKGAECHRVAKINRPCKSRI